MEEKDETTNAAEVEASIVKESQGEDGAPVEAVDKRVASGDPAILADIQAHKQRRRQKQAQKQQQQAIQKRLREPVTIMQMELLKQEILKNYNRLGDRTIEALRAGRDAWLTVDIFVKFLAHKGLIHEDEFKMFFTKAYDKMAAELAAEEEHKQAVRVASEEIKTTAQSLAALKSIDGVSPEQIGIAEKAAIRARATFNELAGITKETKEAQPEKEQTPDA